MSKKEGKKLLRAENENTLKSKQSELNPVEVVHLVLIRGSS
jgi:hypothetical protein